MELVVDTNVAFSFFNRRSKARELVTLEELELIAPKFSRDELLEHKEDIIEAFSLSEFQYLYILRFLETFVRFLPIKEYIKHFESAMDISVDPDDVDFFTLSLSKGKIPIWSNDPHFKKQSEIKVFTTSELVKFLSESK